ncbi:ribonucleases P/MRP protein subunit POP1 isoform X2 [Ziziphus jujuba]|uniref:Ribonucleases P/MRP protein subunit POP1 isoform X2 n=1 Tax=Ziziphus jujuba TaxID=326968 RepID=A0A6P4AP45_ZIZJJ|nr:ribonucleases P/MRP protein subunit POP1 isoform X2 [Ziziphus jujuba]
MAECRGRGSRALLKWFRHNVLIHDASYHVAVQLEGPEDSLLSILRMVLVPSPLVHIDDISHSVKSGVIYNNAMLHHVGAPVSKPVAPVIYMWRPCQNTDTEVAHDSEGCNKPEITECYSSFRQLWVWIHASAFREGYGVLKFACQKEMDERGILINCISLEGELARLEVMGLKAFQLLQKTLNPVTQISENSRHSVSKADDNTKVKRFSVLENEEHVSSNAVLSLTVMDPRTLRNGKKTADALESESTGVEAVIPRDGIDEQCASEEISHKDNKSLSLLCSEPGGDRVLSGRDLWDARSGISPPVEESILCKEKHDLQKNFFCLGDPTSGTLNASTDVQCSRYCPILLLKNKNQKGLDIGWSIILPLSWVRAFWIPLVSNGAHAIGLREKHWIACDVGLPYFPSDFPDCDAYSCFKATEAAASNLQEELRPPAIRPLKVPIPPPWDGVQITLNRGFIKEGDPQVCTEHDSDSLLPNSECADCNVKLRGNLLDGFVARTSCMLTDFLNEIQGNHLLLFPNKIADRNTSILKVVKSGDVPGQSQNRITNIIYNGKLCLLRVTLHAYSRGCFEEGAVVCAPFLTDISSSTSRSENIEGGLQIPQSAVTSYFKEQSSGKWELQIPEDDNDNISHRWPIGFVTTGFVRGSKKPVAEAFCEAVLLAQLRQVQWNEMSVKRRRKEIYVLVRNLRSSAYRLALATIVLEQHEDVEYL